MRKLYLMTTAVLFLSNVPDGFTQKNEKGYCFTVGDANDDAGFNAKIVKKLKKITSLDAFGGYGRIDVQYTGNHVIFDEVNYIKNGFGIVTWRYRTVQAGFKKQDGTCTIQAYIIGEEGLGGGTFSDPDLYNTLQDIAPTTPRIGFKRFLACDCIEATKNWMPGQTGTAANNSNSSGEEKNVNSKNTVTTDPDLVDKPVKAASGQKSSGTASSNSNSSSGIKDGPYESKHSNGTIRETGTYLNGERTGVWTEYDENGTVKKETGYKNNEMDGKWISYINGKKRYEWNYVNGKREGEQRNFSDRGLYNVTEIYMMKNELQEGISKKYDEQGNLKSEELYKAGQRDGLSIRYRDGSKLKAEEQNYVNGKKEGNYVHYDALGKPDGKGQYVNNQMDGKWETYDAGKLKTVANYKNGQKDGTQEWYTAGKLTKTEVWENGVKIQ